MDEGEHKEISFWGMGFSPSDFCLYVAVPRRNLKVVPFNLIFVLDSPRPLPKSFQERFLPNV